MRPRPCRSDRREAARGVIRRDRVGGARDRVARASCRLAAMGSDPGLGLGGGAVMAKEPGKFSDIIVILIGLGLYVLFAFKLHVLLIGVPVA